jgi:hypothetical protein
VRRNFVRAGLIAFAAAWIPVQAAGAANSPAFRDCSFFAGLDPDFIQLSGATVGSPSALFVTSSQTSVTLKASESSDPGDSSGHDTFSVTVTGPGIAPQTVSGQGTGEVTLSVPLSGVAAGGQYTLNWAATFDNGFHMCPSGQTPQNSTTGANPFVLNVVSMAPPPAPLALTKLAESHRKWREKAGTTFSFNLSGPARVKLAFRQFLHGRSVPRGSRTLQGMPGKNSIHFTGRFGNGSRLAPGRYEVVVTATDPSGQRAKAKHIAFTIIR